MSSGLEVYPDIRLIPPCEEFPVIIDHKRAMDAILARDYLGMTRFGDGEYGAMCGKKYKEGRQGQWEHPNELLTEALIEAGNNENLIQGHILYDHARRRVPIVEKWTDQFIRSGLVSSPVTTCSNIWKYALMDGSVIPFLDELFNGYNVVLYGGVTRHLRKDTTASRFSWVIDAPTWGAFENIKAAAKDIATLPSWDLFVLACAGPAGNVLASELAKREVRCLNMGSLFNVIHKPMRSWHFRIRRDSPGLVSDLERVISLGGGRERRRERNKLPEVSTGPQPGEP